VRTILELSVSRGDECVVSELVIAAEEVCGVLAMIQSPSANAGVERCGYSPMVTPSGRFSLFGNRYA
jgi:hypothetical protein